MKKLLIVMIVSILLLSYTMANDCDLVKSTTDFSMLQDWKYDNILPKPAITQALINLKSFCCESKKLDDSSCNTDSRISDDNGYPASVYLYDHILDVSIRRLDAKITNENGTDLIYGLEPDETGKIWREFITKHGNSKDGSIPLEIINKLKENWEVGVDGIKGWGKINKDDWTDEIFEKYTDRKLVDKYNSVCETSIYLYLNLASTTVNNTRLGTAYDNCEDLIQSRIKKEFDYTKSILMQKGNKLLFNNVKSYLDNYFSQNKLMALQQLIFTIKNTFNEVNKAISELVSKCS